MDQATLIRLLAVSALLAASAATKACSWKGHCEGDMCTADGDCDGSMTCVNKRCGTSDGTITPGADASPGQTSKVALSTAELITSGFKSTSWNVVKTSHYDKSNSKVVTMSGPNGTEQAVMEVFYPQCSANPADDARPQGGVNFYAAPSPVFPLKSVHVKYSVQFANNFQWVKGGKLPGIWIDSIGASGCKHPGDGSSFRVMWREGGQGEAYIYIPEQPRSSGLHQGPDVKKSSDCGLSLWRGQFNFVIGGWNTIELVAKVNTAGAADGEIGLTINGKSKTFKGIKWSDSDKPQVSGLFFSTFFGGKGAEWATPVDTHTHFTGVGLKLSR